MHFLHCTIMLSSSIILSRAFLANINKGRNAALISIRSSGKQQPKNREGMGKPKGFYDLKNAYRLQQHLLSGSPSTRPFLVLGIESSCDDTGVAVVSSNGTILSNCVYSQYKIHEKFGGIVPSLAMEAHKVNIDKAIADAIQKAGLSSIDEVDAIAVTRGPGLEICLRIGYQKAQSLAVLHRKSFVSVHHHEAHCMIARVAGETITDVDDSTKDVSASPVDASSSQPIVDFLPRVEFPFLTLLASGGHTSIVICHGIANYTVLGGTLDDSLGEAFDKVARLLGLDCKGLSGGAAVEQAAAEFAILKDTSGYASSRSDGRGADTIANNGALELTANPSEAEKVIGLLKVPMREKVNCDFSYAGLKNSFRMAVQQVRRKYGLDADSTNAPPGQMEEGPAQDELVALPEAEARALCYAFQNVAFTHVEDKIKRALYAVERLQVPITALVVVGGVAANKQLRRVLLRLLDERYVAQVAAVALFQASTASSSSCTSNPPTPQPRRLPLVFPPPSLCTDNGAMIAWTGVEKLLLGISDAPDGEGAEEVIARWPLGAPLEDEALFKKL